MSWPLRTILSSCLLIALLMNSNLSGELSASHERQDWYWDSVVNLHLDNHNLLVGQGHSAEELAAMISSIPVEMIQVSAYGAPGHIVTYPTRRLPKLENPDLDGFDTLGAWREAAELSGKRFHVYMNTRGLWLHRQRSDWMQQNAEGRGRGRREDLYDVCARPTPEGNGFLEEILLPMLEEISREYRPGGFWIDGDWTRTPTCYCDHCRAAWRIETGATAPPTESDDPDWSDWLRFQQDRYDAYRQQMAETVHRENPAAMYTSNHSWRKSYGRFVETHDPRDPPAFADTLSADLSHADSLQRTRLAAMLLSADQTTPRDLMHVINSDRISLGRVLQKGGLTLSFGGPWFLWVRGDTFVQPEAQARTLECAEFARTREEACGRSVTMNPYAVLVSETSWQEERFGHRSVGFYDPTAANDFALAFQDAACGVDLVNESLFRQHPESYRKVIVPNQRQLASGTLRALEGFARAGGLVLLTGDSMRPDEAESPEVARLLGLERTGRHEEATELQTDHGRITVPASQQVALTEAEVIVAFMDGRPALTRHEYGRGQVWWLNAAGIESSDMNYLVAWLSRHAALRPSFQISAPDAPPHLVLSIRRKGEDTIYHWTDLTSHVDGVRVPPEESDLIDDPVPVDEVQVIVPMAQPPQSVRVVPQETTVQYEWNEGALSLTLNNLYVHAAVLVQSKSNWN